jgi:hypothetical protein
MNGQALRHQKDRTGYEEQLSEILGDDESAPEGTLAEGYGRARKKAELHPVRTSDNSVTLPYILELASGKHSGQAPCATENLLIQRIVIQ